MATGWFGNLTVFPQQRMVKFKKEVAEVLTVGGQEINPAITNIPLVRGWNDIAYMLRSDAAIDAAFDLSTLPAGEVLLKGASGSAVYYAGSGWTGELATLQVLHGYKIHVESAGNLRYDPAGSAKKSLSIASTGANSVSGPGSESRTSGGTGTSDISGTSGSNGTVSVSGTDAKSGTISSSGTAGSNGTVSVSGTDATSGTVNATGTEAASGTISSSGTAVASGNVNVSVSERKKLLEEYGLQPERYEHSATLIAEVVSSNGKVFTAAG
ncbi:MAG: hypothetical protein LC655_03130, partial [Bacteroidales bacterium]|nr:hypothetical protein [Bacteroidales bacterium]